MEDLDDYFLNEGEAAPTVEETREEDKLLQK